jgi:hypothetical protein
MFSGLCFLFIFFLFVSCKNEEEKAFDTIKDIILEFRQRVEELDKFYIKENGGKKLSRDPSVIVSYYSKMSLLADFVIKTSGDLRDAKRFLVRRGRMPNFKIPKIFLKKKSELEKIKIEINLKLSILIPRVRKTKYSAGELKTGQAGSEKDYYSKGVHSARKKKTHAELKGELKHTAPESFSVGNVHKKYFY